jgi:hypothetical protein
VFCCDADYRYLVNSEITANALIAAFAPVLVYSFLHYLTAELIRNMNEDEQARLVHHKTFSRILALALVVLSCYCLIFTEFNTIEHDWGGTTVEKIRAAEKHDQAKQRRQP